MRFEHAMITLLLLCVGLLAFVHIVQQQEINWQQEQSFEQEKRLFSLQLKLTQIEIRQFESMSERQVSRLEARNANP